MIDSFVALIHYITNFSNSFELSNKRNSVSSSGTFSAKVVAAKAAPTYTLDVKRSCKT